MKDEKECNRQPGLRLPGALFVISPEYDFEAAKKIETLSGLAMPKQLSELAEKEPRFTNVCEREEMAGFVLSTVGGDY